MKSHIGSKHAQLLITITIGSKTSYATKYLHSICFEHFALNWSPQNAITILLVCKALLYYSNICKGLVVNKAQFKATGCYGDFDFIEVT